MGEQGGFQILADQLTRGGQIVPPRVLLAHSAFCSFLRAPKLFFLEMCSQDFISLRKKLHHQFYIVYMTQSFKRFELPIQIGHGVYQNSFICLSLRRLKVRILNWNLCTFKRGIGQNSVESARHLLSRGKTCTYQKISKIRTLRHLSGRKKYYISKVEQLSCIDN